MPGPAAVTPARQVLFEPFAKQQEFLDASLSGQYSFILYGGAIRGGKTYCLLALFILLARFFPGSRWAIIRKDLPTIRRNLYPSWDKIKPGNFIARHDQQTHTITFSNGSQLVFFPESYDTDKDLNRMKGFEANGFGFEEINECQQQTLYKAFERAGSYLIKGAAVQPKPLVVATCNPTSGWVKDLIYTPWKEGTLKPTWLYIQSRIYDNTPLLTQQPHYLPQLKENLNRYEYQVFVEGDWDVQLKTGGEFLRGFEVFRHVQPVAYNPEATVHIAIDSNVYPHIAITCWQLMKDEAGVWDIRQVDELPAEDPENTASQSAAKIAGWLKAMAYTGRVYLYGDKSTKNRNNIDDNKRSFFQIIDQHLRQCGYATEDKMLRAAPPVASVADFVNAILSAELPFARIRIGEHCKKSINDYIETKTDKDGTMLKKRVAHPTLKGVTYEPHGHLTDTLKDFIVQAFHSEYLAYINRHSRLVPGGISQVKRGGKVVF